MNPKESKSNQPKYVLDPQKNWITRYVEISTHLCFRDFDRNWFEDIHVDIVRDLFNDSLENDIILHLLSLIELMLPLFDSNKKIEETFTALLKLIKNDKPAGRKTADIQKHFQCATSLMLYFKELMFEDNDISKLFTDFIHILMENAYDQQSLHYETCLDCLSEISLCYPEMIDISKNKILKPRNIMETYYILPLLDQQRDVQKIRELVQQLVFEPDIKFYHICIKIYQLVLSGCYEDSFSLLIFRPFLAKFIFSNQIHNIQLALKLLIEFGFDIYTSREEELFLRQMVQSCTIPALPVGHRLLLLAFIKIAFDSIFKPPLNSPPLSLLNCLHPILFDGSDIQEKKLVILNQSSFVVTDDEFFSMLTNLHKKCSSEYRNYERATNSLFHIINQVIKKRLQLTDRILQLLLDSFFNTFYVHYIKKFCLFWNDHKELGQNLTDNFVAKLMVLTKNYDNNIESTKKLPAIITSYKGYSVYLNFINWFLSVAHRNIHLTEFQLEFLVNFIYRNSIHYRESSTLALQCCTSILYYQRVTPKVKGALLVLLEWLKNERKSDLEASSLAQIYLLALRTLAEESIKQVFTSDEEEFLYQTPEMFEQYLSNVKNNLKECPVNVERLSEKVNNQKQKYGSLLSKILQFNVSLNSKSKFEKVFCVEIEFASIESDNFTKIFQIACIEIDKKPLTISLPIDFLIKDSIQLDISVKFVDFKGNIYNCYKNKSEVIMFEDLLIPLELESQLNIESVVEVIKENTLKHSESLQTVICVRNHNSFQFFLAENEWMKKFLLDDEQNLDNLNCLNFLIGISPDRIIIGAIKLINDFINILIVTNHFNIMPSFFSKFHDNVRNFLNYC